MTEAVTGIAVRPFQPADAAAVAMALVDSSSYHAAAGTAGLRPTRVPSVRSITAG